METLNTLARAGVTTGFLWRLPHGSASRLLADALRLDVPAGASLYREDEPPRILAVLDGTLRVLVRGEDGRLVTVRHVHRGEIVGLALVVGGPAPVSIEAVGPARVLAFRPEVLAELVRTDAETGRVCAAELAHQVVGAFEDAASQMLLPLRDRITARLLDLAVTEPSGVCVARVTQQALADEVGTAREVVTRLLASLRRAGLIETGRDSIVILDPDALRARGPARTSP